MVKIIQNHKDCIGCGTCVALCPAFWEMPARNASRSKVGEADDAKARPTKGAKNPKTGNYEFEVEKAGCNQEAADACPLQLISIEK
jgi:ferredoxin